VLCILLHRFPLVSQLSLKASVFLVFSCIIPGAATYNARVHLLLQEIHFCCSLISFTLSCVDKAAGRRPTGGSALQPECFGIGAAKLAGGHSIEFAGHSGSVVISSKASQPRFNDQQHSAIPTFTFCITHFTFCGFTEDAGTAIALSKSTPNQPQAERRNKRPPN
jgi:hypothetical protein